MTGQNFFTPEERKLFLALYHKLLRLTGDSFLPADVRKLKTQLVRSIESGKLQRDIFVLNPLLKSVQTAIIVADEIGMKRASVMGIMLHESVSSGVCSIDDVEHIFGSDVAGIVRGLIRVQELYVKSPSIESENFRKLLLTFAEDMRVILIIIADRVNIMRQIRDVENDEARLQVANEAAYLYAPLAHKLGLYALKSELEDLSLKYTEHDMYYHIREKLNETKKSRDAYIERFIQPLQKHLEEAGLKFHIKGRTKSIHSIYQKMKKQKCPFEGVYDLFAIRVILDSPLEKEKMQCWQVYSIVTDMYQPNPKRLRDWLSVPKSNGYESLHITVMGPEGKWVEVQIRTERMDEVAERGLAAHWRYKGIKGETGLDDWLTSVREALESSEGTGLEAMDQFKMDLYEDEVFVFTPKGDLYKLPKGATVLDFAFMIHTKLGCSCTGGKVNGKNVPIRQELKSGDQVEIMSSASQTPKQGWLKIVVTSKARTKIKQALKETEARQSAFAKEELERKLKNRKIDFDESIMMRVIKRMGYKIITDFYQQIANGNIDTTRIIDEYVEQLRRETENVETQTRTAEGFSLQMMDGTEENAREDVLVIDQNLKGIQYQLAQCCHPIYGDDIFGFVSIKRGIMIHRMNCPNAHDMRERYGYRIVKARWAGKSVGSQYPITLMVVGNDDIGIVTNITSIINKEDGITLRSIGIEANDGLFNGQLTVMVSDTSKLNALIKKLKTVKGVKNISRI
ncbi:MAG: bifunctional (p)ppGpp synthetase/guanosine-3',5'-bis(diphosphate) 3'-pyrophosphohydrolase [Bacteroidaceae bacterium]|nr:bifunctional (p)ppGpp synthetase/guanosine-3',5'-bis(diphosphate) 3'-pyrophosphohydrolase [Bacteroidaceae bacterium]